MSVLFARLGLAESRAAALGRGRRRPPPVKSGSLSGDCLILSRKISSRRRGPGGRVGTGEFGLSEEELQDEEKRAGKKSLVAEDSQPQSDAFGDFQGDDRSSAPKKSWSSVMWADESDRSKSPSTSASMTWKSAFLEGAEPKPKPLSSRFPKRPPRAVALELGSDEGGLPTHSAQGMTAKSKDSGKEVSDRSIEADTEALTRRMIQLLDQAGNSNADDSLDKRFEELSLDQSWSHRSQDIFQGLSASAVDEGTSESASAATQEEEDLEEIKGYEDLSSDLRWSAGHQDDFWAPSSSAVGDDSAVDQSEEELSSDPRWSADHQDDFWESSSRAVGDDPAVDPSEEELLPENDPSSGTLEQDAFRQFLEANNVWSDEEKEEFLKIDYKVELPVALERNDYDTVARCLYAAQTNADVELIRDLSESTFTQILDSLQFRRSLGEAARGRSYVNDRMARDLGIERFHQMLWSFGQVLLDISKIRRNSGHRLTEAQYRILLGSAKDGGDKTLAMGVWRQMYEDGVAPDLSMYNAFLGAFVWAGNYDVQQRRRQRVTIKNLAKRAQGLKTRPYYYHGVGKGGIRERSTAILTAMLKDGITANEESYRLMITGAAREGAMDHVTTILLKVWNIDVDALMETGLQETSTMKTRKLPIDHPQHPTVDLLFTLAHAFSINNNISTALRVVDYVAQEYKLTINEDTWSLLFEWTFVLVRRRNSNKYPDSDQGKLPLRAVLKMWDTMTNAPYFVKPDIDLYDRLMKTLYLNKSHSDMEAKMLEAFPLYVESVEIQDEAWSILMRSLWDSKNERRPKVPITEARRQFEQAIVNNGRHFLLMKRWMLLYLAGFGGWSAQDVKENGLSTNRIVRTLPRMLWDWRKFVKSFVRYETQTGLVEIQFRTDAEMLRDSVRREGHHDMRKELARQAPFMISDKWSLQSEGTTRRLQKARKKGLVPEKQPVFQWSRRENDRLGKLVRRMERMVRQRKIRREVEAQKSGDAME